MISRIDCYKILKQIQDSGINTDEIVLQLSNSTTIPKSVVDFINKNRPQYLYLFYEDLKKKNNKRENKLFKNLLKEENTELERILSLTAYISQVFIYSEKLNTTEKIKFYEQCNLTQCIGSLYNYVDNKDYSCIMDVYDLIKTDINILLMPAKGV